MLLSAIWRRLDEPGHDAARLQKTASGWLLSGTAVYLADSGPATLEYRVTLANDWTTFSGAVRGFVGDQEFDLTILRDGDRWTVNGKPQPAVQGMLDLDYNFTPATNLPQIRRMQLNIGDKANFPVAWLVAGSGDLVVLPQTYERLTQTEYAYEAPTVPYRAKLVIAEEGFAQSYPDGWIIDNANKTTADGN